MQSAFSSLQLAILIADSGELSTLVLCWGVTVERPEGSMQRYFRDGTFGAHFALNRYARFNSADFEKTRRVQAKNSVSQREQKNIVDICVEQPLQQQ